MASASSKTPFWVLLVVGALLVAACGSSSSPSPSVSTSAAPSAGASVALEPIKVAGLWPLSGENAAVGNGQKAAFQFAIDSVNAAGGIKSLGGRPIQVVYGDTQSKPDVAASETQRLIQQEGVVTLVGCYQSGITLPASQKAQELKTPFIDDIAINDTITERGYDYVFRTGPKSSWYVRDEVAFLQYLGTVTGTPVKRVALLHEDSDYGMGAAAQQTAELQAQGIEVVADISYTAQGVASLTTQVQKVKASNPDAVLTVTYLNDSILIMRARADLGMTDVPFLDLAGGTIDPEFINQLGGQADGILTLVEFSPLATGLGQEVSSSFKQVSGDDLTGNSAWAYNAALVVAAALEKAGSADRDAIKEALTGLTVSEGIIGPATAVKFGPDGQNENAQVFVAQIQEGQLMPVWPAEFAAADLKVGQ